ncbi:MAG: DUF4332 domain-containing protein, partial [Planctomycetales bacterium]|nr:DUF4332 domain-containing protein [Planctomycetales bacterium]
MKLASLEIERFGARSNLQLDQLSDRLNVVYGPNGSGKTTIIHFIRWVLFGSQDDSGRRYLSGNDGRTGGSLQVVDGHHRRLSVTRHHDSLHHDQVHVTGESPDATYGIDPNRLTGVSVNEYRHVYCFGFDQSPLIEHLVQAISHREFGIAFDEHQLSRLRELTERLEHLRRSFPAYAGEESFPGLLERRRQLQTEIAQWEQRRVERLRQLQVEIDQLQHDIYEDRRQLDELDAVLRRTDSNIEIRRRQLDEAAREAQLTRDRWSDDRRQEVADIDYQLQQWHQVLEAIRQRNDRLQSQLVNRDPQVALSALTDESELRVFLRSLGYQTDDIDQDLRDLDVSEVADERTRSEYLRSVFQAALHSMRDDVQRLVRELQRQKSNSHHHDQSREQDHLRRCETELSSLIDALTKRRTALLASPEFSEVNWLPTTSSTATYPAAYQTVSSNYASSYASHTPLSGPTSGYRELPVSAHARTWHDPSHSAGSSSSANGSSVGLNGSSYPSTYASNSNGYYAGSNGYNNNNNTNNNPLGYSLPPSPATYPTSRTLLIDPVLEARLAHLVKRRDYLSSRMRELESELSAAERRLEALQAELHGTEEDRQIERIRRELESIDQRMRQAEERQRRREEIESLERQIEELRRHVGPSEILRDASAILARLTEGAHRGLRVGERGEVWVEDDRGHALSPTELSRGTRDQVYLSLTLALVSAYRRRGIELPMVLNDIFINIDTERAEATAEVLSHFAAQGHQILLFTRHEHVMRRFERLQAKLYTLRERHRAPEPMRAPLPAPREPLFRHDGYYLDQVPFGAPSAPTAWVPPTPPRRPVEPREVQPRERIHDWQPNWEPPRRPAPVRPVMESSVNDGTTMVLAESTLLSQVEGLNPQHVQRLRELGVHTVLQFLEMEPEDGERHLAHLGVPAATLFRWQSELALQCYVGLSANDASLLVACGVDDPEELSYIDASELHRRIESFLSTQDSRSRYGSIIRFERPRLARWIQAARRSHYRRPRQRFSRYRNGQRPAARPLTAPRAENTERHVARTRRVEPRRVIEPRVVEPRVVEPRTTERVAEPRTVARRPETESIQTLVERKAFAREADRTAVDRAETLRFYLEPADPIVDAPSIGPKTAERFHAIGVTTVQELLDLDANDAAARINYRRIT